MNTIPPQGIGAASLISEGMAPNPMENVFIMNTRSDKLAGFKRSDGTTAFFVLDTEEVP